MLIQTQVLISIIIEIQFSVINRQQKAKKIQTVGIFDTKCEP